MKWNYRRRLKTIPGIHLNLSRSGISTSIGVKGASLTLGRDGAYLNSSVPGLGIYSRQKISPTNEVVTPGKGTPPPQQAIPSESSNGNIFSADPHEITSQDMQGVKETIIAAHDQRKQLSQDLADVKKAIRKSKSKLAASYVLLYGLINKKVSRAIKEDISHQTQAMAQIAEQIQNSVVKLDVEFDNDLREAYKSLVESFNRLCKSEKIWDVTSSHSHDRVKSRSAASTLVRKKEVRFDDKGIPDIDTNFNPLHLQNGNGADIYCYPNFIIVYSSSEKFAIIGFEELQFKFSSVSFIETGTVPSDSKVVDMTWAKVNKNGTPDKRFKDNCEIPIVRYGNISLQTATGLNEQYEFSNYEFAEGFADSFLSYQQTIGHLKTI